MPDAVPPASAGRLQDLWSRRLVWVTGKGGTGKTTCAAALAMVHAAAGRRTVLVEVDAQRPSLTAIVGQTPPFDPVSVSPNLWAANLTWNEALMAYLRRMMPLQAVVRRVLDNAVVRQFLDFTPGARELVTLSAVADLRERYDVVVVDMPASGHAFALLDITRTAGRLFRSGPVAGRVKELTAMLRAPDTAVLLVALPELMVVNETLETAERLVAGGLVHDAPSVWLNRAPAVHDGALVTLPPDQHAALLAATTSAAAQGALSDPGWKATALWALDRDAAASEAAARLASLDQSVLALAAHHDADSPYAVARAVAEDLAMHAQVRLPAARGGA